MNNKYLYHNLLLLHWNMTQLQEQEHNFIRLSQTRYMAYQIHSYQSLYYCMKDKNLLFRGNTQLIFSLYQVFKKNLYSHFGVALVSCPYFS